MHPSAARTTPRIRKTNNVAGAIYLGLIAATSLAIAAASGFVGTL